MIKNGIRNGLESPEILRHVAVALTRHVRQLRKDGLPVPAELDELASFLMHSVMGRPEMRAPSDKPAAAQEGRATGQLLVTKAEAARRLGVSVRTVERLVVAGRLPLVHVERAARLRVSDLDAFVRNLPDDQASPGS